MPVRQFDNTKPSTPTVSECSEATLPLFPRDWNRHLRAPLSHESRYSQALLDTLGCKKLVSVETAIKNFKSWIEECGGAEQAYGDYRVGSYPEDWVEIRDVCLERDPRLTRVLEEPCTVCRDLNHSLVNIIHPSQSGLELPISTRDGFPALVDGCQVTYPQAQRVYVKRMFLRLGLRWQDVYSEKRHQAFTNEYFNAPRFEYSYTTYSAVRDCTKVTCPDLVWKPIHGILYTPEYLATVVDLNNLA